ncbi:hypothetical protein [Streptomyces sp. V2I9]|uniref:hypothetical protein n=1 Tax=Streptomyces sp. V2I9 TaxID=3042304 RepID=UPI00277D60C4|nr:hypothetical protein [Streptomyces sp. V2I9]MDQ0983235.1 uncharacterized protein (DUF2249 family) [Streptomyces sp. V2I9]
MESATTVIVTIAIAKVFALTALWLRLRRQAQREQERHRYLLGMTGKLSTGGTVELDDRGDAGHHLYVKVDAPAGGERGRAA